MAQYIPRYIEYEQRDIRQSRVSSNFQTQADFQHNILKESRSSTVSCSATQQTKSTEVLRYMWPERQNC